FATGRFARRCTAIASGDMGGLAARAACPNPAEGARLLINVTLAVMNSFVDEKMRDRAAAACRSFPEAEGPRRAETIVGLLIGSTRRGAEHTPATPESHARKNGRRLVGYKENSYRCDF